MTAAGPHGLHAGLYDMPRHERRAILKDNARRRRIGDWGAWETFALPDGLPTRTGGWTRAVRRIHRNRVFAVLERPVDGGVHLAVSSLTGLRPSWPEMQRIKDDLGGPDRMAVEIYPPADDVVDGADMFHLWLLDSPLPFNLAGPAK